MEWPGYRLLCLSSLGVHRAEEVAPSAFLVSIHATSLLTQSILFTNFFLLSSRAVQEALSLWSLGHAFSPPSGEVACRQQVWDHLRAEAAAVHLLECACDDEDRARLLASTHKELGAWLNALPILSAGIRLDDDSFRIAIGLCLGTPLCSPHVCHHCNEQVGILGRHGVSCRRSEGRHCRHAACY